MKAKSLLILGFCLLTTIAFCQKEANVWYFGRKAGIDFNSGTPVALTDGQLNTREGCASVANRATGELLFYTDGVKVYNRNHLVMPNGSGLFGSTTSTQSAIIVPIPGTTNRYYIFTTGTKNTGMNYSEVDMDLNGGLGDVIPLVKNQLLLSDNTEKLIATKHNNGIDFWIITHEADKDLFYVYLVSASGISSPIISKTGSIITDYSDETGYLKVSTDGSRLANAINGALKKRVEIFNFNNATGEIATSPIILSGLPAAYGLEFSIDGRFLYVSQQIQPTNSVSKIVQYDLQAGDQLAINSSKFILSTSTSLSYGALQLAPDGKIYVAKENGIDVGVNALGVIDKPSTKATSTSVNFYVENGFALAGKLTLIGLPTFAGKFAVPYAYRNICLGDETAFEIVNTSNVKSASWNFDDPTSGTANASTQLAPKHTFTKAGTYKVSLTIDYSDTTPQGVYTITVIIGAVLDIELGRDVTLCLGETLSLNPLGTTPAPTNATFRWKINGVPSTNTTSTFTADAPGTYSVEVAIGSCKTKDSIIVSYLSATSVNLGRDTTICAGTTLILQANAPGATYQWSTGYNQSSLKVDESGTYWVKVTTGKCEIIDSIDVNIVPAPFFALGRDTTLCVGNTLTLSARNANPATTYLWKGGSVGPEITVTEAGIYWAEATLGDCKIRDSITVQYITSAPSVNLGNDTIIFNRYEEPTILNAFSEGSVYRWHDGSTESSLTISEPGEYWVLVKNSCGSASDTVFVVEPDCSEFEIPNIITPNGDGFNDTFVAVCGDGRWSLVVYDRWGNMVYSDGVYKNDWDAKGIKEENFYYYLKNNISGAVVKGWLHVEK